MPEPNVTPAPKSRSSWWMLAALLLATFAIRGGAIWGMRGQLEADPDAYRMIAEGWIKTGVYTRDVPEDAGEVPNVIAPTAYRPPLYPLLLTHVARRGEVSASAVAALHLGLGLATVALCYQLALAWELSPRSAVAAALLVACDPILLQQSSLVMTETLATFLAVACLWLLTWSQSSLRLGHLALAGGTFGLAILCRPTFLPWLGLVALVFAALPGRHGERALRPLVLLLAAGVIIAPWAWRNQQVFGRPIVTTTHGGYTLYLANNDRFYDWLQAGSAGPAWQPDEAFFRITSWRHWVLSSDGDRHFAEAEAFEQRHGARGLARFELKMDQQLRDEAWECIRRRPGMFANASLVRLVYLWGPLPQQTAESESTYRTLARYLVAIWYAGVYLLAAFGVFHLRGKLGRTPWLWGLTLCLTITAIHTVYWSNLRMRAPAMPVVALLAAASLMPRESTRKVLP